MENEIILVCVHKPYCLPDLPPVYQPIQVGNGPEINTAYLRDNTAKNITEKNKTFCELTALYWAWMNLDTEALGLCHYRRFFGSPVSMIRRIRKKNGPILAGSQIEMMLKGYDMILPVKRHYWIETRESQYEHAHHAQDLRCVEGILAERYPDYLPAWKWMLRTRSGHICNMFIMRRELADAYCKWLFDILFEAERRLDISSYSEKDKRVFGYLGERLLDVWIQKNNLRYTEVPVINLEKQHWLHKGASFLRRKLQNQREERCF